MSNKVSSKKIFNQIEKIKFLEAIRTVVSIVGSSIMSLGVFFAFWILGNKRIKKKKK